MTQIYDWYYSLSPLTYWAIIVLLSPLCLMLLGLVVCLLDTSSIGNFFDAAQPRYGR